MNRVTLIGRWSKDPDLRYTPNGQAVVNVAIAVDKPPRNGEDAGADFVNVVIWGKMAEATANYTGKGHLVGVDGRLQTRSYTDKEEIKRYVTEVVAGRVEFLARPGNGGKPKDKDTADATGALNEFDDLDLDNIFDDL